MEVDELSTCSAATLMCCMCDRLLQDPVLLSCLHNCCRMCFDEAASQSADVACATCKTTTRAGFGQSNIFIDHQVWLYRIMNKSKTCDVCNDGKSDREILSCCTICRLVLCERCTAYHTTFQNNHHTILLQDIESFEVSQQSLAASCVTHNKPLDIYCLNCVTAKCVVCWVPCHQLKHEMRVVGEESFEEFVRSLTRDITSFADDLLRKFKAFQKPESVLNELKGSRKSCLEQLHQRKVRIVAAVESVYQEIEDAAKNAYDELQKEAYNASARSDRLQSGIDTAGNYIQQLVKSNKQAIVVQYTAVRDCLNKLSVEHDKLRWIVDSIRTPLNFTSSLPDDMTPLLREWIGVPPVLPADVSLPQGFSFAGASPTVKVPVDCLDLALTKDLHLLLAAGQNGLIEFSQSGCELSRWCSPRWNNVEPDYVQSVVHLIDGRVAAALYQSKLIMLLRRIEKHLNDETEGDPWIVDRQLEPLQFSPGCLAIHGDVLAVSQWRGDRLLSKSGDFSMTQPLGQRLQLMSVSSGQRLGNELSREYQIGSLAVASRMVVTASPHNVREFQFPMASVIDAYSLVNVNENLWRYRLRSIDNQQVMGICADSTGSVLYAAVYCFNMRKIHVVTINMINGSQLRIVPIAVDGLFHPTRIALSDIGVTEQVKLMESDRFCTVAALCHHGQMMDFMAVVIYCST